MEARKHRTPVGDEGDRKVEAPPRKKFRLVKLEERIAPGHYNPHSKWVGNHDGQSSDPISSSVGY